MSLEKCSGKISEEQCSGSTGPLTELRSRGCSASHAQHMVPEIIPNLLPRAPTSGSALGRFYNLRFFCVIEPDARQLQSGPSSKRQEDWAPPAWQLSSSSRECRCVVSSGRSTLFPGPALGRSLPASDGAVVGPVESGLVELGLAIRRRRSSAVTAWSERVGGKNGADPPG